MEPVTKSVEEKFKFIKPGEVRTRFAPSPTGFLHIGSARTALFNYLFAKKYQGSFILRIEDTDIERSKSVFEEDIIENLKWLGIEWDEGPVFADKSKENQKYIGEHGPYRQSERRSVYKKYLEQLLKEGKAYYCFCSEEELEAQKQEQMSRGLPPRYNGKCAHLSAKEIKENLSQKKESIIRFKVPSKKIKLDDIVRGKVEFDSGLIGDIVIAKNLNAPLYNFAVVIDDFEMKISHVIRGEDLLPNTPIQILLQEALGFSQPQYGHLPLILGTDKSKLSKRHGAVAVAEYQKKGYLPETLINFLAFLGWNPGSEREIYSLASLIKEFSIERVQKGGAIFNIKRLDFLNGFYIRQKSSGKLAKQCIPYLIQGRLIEPVLKSEQYPPAYGGMSITQSYKVVETGKDVSFGLLQKIVAIYQERLKRLSEIVELTEFFFQKELNYKKELLQWKNMSDKEIADVLDRLTEILSEIKEENWNKENLENILMLEAEKIGPEGLPASPAGDRGRILWPLRVALTGKKATAGPFEIAEILGKEKTLERIKIARALV